MSEREPAVIVEAIVREVEATNEVRVKSPIKRDPFVNWENKFMVVERPAGPELKSRIPY